MPLNYLFGPANRSSPTVCKRVTLPLKFQQKESQTETLHAVFVCRGVYVGVFVYEINELECAGAGQRVNVELKFPSTLSAFPWRGCRGGGKVRCWRIRWGVVRSVWLRALWHPGKVFNKGFSSLFFAHSNDFHDLITIVQKVTSFRQCSKQLVCHRYLSSKSIERGGVVTRVRRSHALRYESTKFQEWWEGAVFSVGTNCFCKPKPVVFQILKKIVASSSLLLLSQSLTFFGSWRFFHITNSSSFLA